MESEPGTESKRRFLNLPPPSAGDQQTAEGEQDQSGRLRNERELDLVGHVEVSGIEVAAGGVRIHSRADNGAVRPGLAVEIPERLNAVDVAGSLGRGGRR
ncbi:MAG: hypothetical protein AMXMBFR13_27730 [Phycisphaerae bacterium]